VIGLNSFLLSAKRNSNDYYTSSSDEDMSVDSEDDELDDEDDDRSVMSDGLAPGAQERFPNPAFRDLNNNIRNNNPNNNAAVNKINTVEENITNLSGLKIYPDSLKNITRIKIKESMSIYNPVSAEKLPNLPESLRRFIVFQDEIDLIKKLTQDEIPKEYIRK
jgi:hypothetical protein